MERADAKNITFKRAVMAVADACKATMNLEQLPVWRRLNLTIFSMAKTGRATSTNLYYVLLRRLSSDILLLELGSALVFLLVGGFLSKTIS